MLRLREKIPEALARGLITLLLALGMGMPLLAAAGQSFLLPRYAMLCAAVSVFCALLNLRRRLLAWGLLLLALGQGLLFAFGQGFFQQTLQLMRALVLLIRDVPLAMVLNGDALCCQLAIWLTLFCYMLSSPDIDVALPVTITAGLLAGDWMLGLHRESLYMLPVLPALLLSYTLTHSFENTPETHALRFSPWAVPLAAALLALAWLISPQEGFKSPKLAQWADDLREAINDRFFFQQERARYSLAADGWMPLGERRLGGRPDPDERLVMYVNASDTTYLRGAIMDTYTGAYWYDSISARRYYWNSPLYRARRDELFQAAYPLTASPAAQRFSVQFASSGASTLFVPQRIRSLETGEHMTPYFNQGSEIFLTRNLKSGNSYGGEYLSMQATDSGMAALAAQAARVEDPMYSAAVSAYTLLPDHIQQELFDMAASITANCESDWQKAVALRNYLRANYRYSLDVQVPPRDVDFAAWFLLCEKQGYCTYFATAMTVLSRIAGLPARYVEGYAANPDANGIAEVHGTNAHAWTEIYFNGLGWVTFDATPGYGSPDNSGSSAPPPSGPSATPPKESPDSTPTPPATPTPSPAPTPSPLPDQPDSPSVPPAAPEQTPTPTPSPAPDQSTPTPEPDTPQTPVRHSLWWLWLLLILALIALLAWRIRSADPLRRANRQKNGGDALILLWQAILQCAALLKTPMQPDETLLDYGFRAGNALGLPLQETAQAVSALRYGRHAPGRGELRGAKNAYAQLRQRLNPLQKAFLSLKYAFTFTPFRKRK